LLLASLAATCSAGRLDGTLAASPARPNIVLLLA
jgi:hypothetical protein